MRSGALNQLINFFWTILCFAPVIWHWYTAGWGAWAFAFTVLSFIFGCLPRRFLAWTALSRSRKGFERLGVKTFRKLTQNGDWANAASGAAGSIMHDVAAAERYLKTVNMYERFHLICGCFFLLSSIHAFALGAWLPGMLILLANAIFNLAAIILQQYNRLRIGRLLRRQGE